MAKLSPRGRLWMGQNTLNVPLELFALNRTRLLERLATQNLGNSIVLLQGGQEIQKYDQDIYFIFQQESNFRWCFGVVEPDFYGAIEVETGNSMLFMPRYEPEYAVWEGPIWTNEDIRIQYQVDEVYYVDEMPEILSNKNPNSLITLRGTNEMSGSPSLEANFDGIENFTVNGTVLYREIIGLRTFKTVLELDVMRYAMDVSAEAHRRVMLAARPGAYEYQCEAEFLYYCYRNGGCRDEGYTCICGSGPNSAILHYGHAASPNDKQIEDGDMCCFDMGAQYFGYSADITSSFPANGIFTNDQRIVYNAVLRAVRNVESECRPGVLLADMYILAVRTILEGLRAGGLLTGDIDAMIAAGMGLVFQPHGISHFLGLDVHDVGNNVPSFRKPLQKFTRPMAEGMVFTVEPGCYFIDHLLDKALADPVQSQFLVPEVIERFRGFGGVRIEDCVRVIEDGIEVMTPNLPRTVEEIEEFMANGRHEM